MSARFRIPPAAALVALGAWLLAPALASALTLTVDPAQSEVSDGSTSEALSGSLEIELGSAAGTSTTTFDVRSLVLLAPGLSVGLDPAAPNPGAGVVNAAGAFLIPTLFVAFDVGPGSLALALPDVSGSVEFGGVGLSRLTASLEIDPGDGGPVRTFSVVALPEPQLALWLGVALVAAGRRAMVPLAPEGSSR